MTTNKETKLLARKLGMSSLWIENKLTPVTLIEILDHKTIKTLPNNRILVGAQPKPLSKLNSPEKGQFTGLDTGYSFLYETDYLPENLASFFDTKKVTIQGRCKSKGFAGGIKRHNFSSRGWSHGVTKSHRGIGSIGQCQDPGRVWPGRKMPGHLGGHNVTLQSRVLSFDLDKRLLVVRGQVPGTAKRTILTLTQS